MDFENEKGNEYENAQASLKLNLKVSNENNNAELNAILEKRKNEQIENTKNNFKLFRKISPNTPKKEMSLLFKYSEIFEELIQKDETEQELFFKKIKTEYGQNNLKTLFRNYCRIKFSSLVKEAKKEIKTEDVFITDTKYEFSERVKNAFNYQAETELLLDKLNTEITKINETENPVIYSVVKKKIKDTEHDLNLFEKLFPRKISPRSKTWYKNQELE